MATAPGVKGDEKGKLGNGSTKIIDLKKQKV